MMTESPSGADAGLEALRRSGRLRLGLFLPQYVKDAASGALQGRGTGFAATRLAPLLASRLGLALETLGYPTPASVVAALRAGECDIVFLGIEPSREAVLDFSPAIFEFDYTYLLPAGAAIGSAAEADRPGVRIAVVEGHASALALAKQLRHARLLGAVLPEAAFDHLRAGRADALACPRDVLLDLAPRLPGSRVLADGYGVNRVGIASRKGEAALSARIAAFVAEIKSSGAVARLVESPELRGFRATG